MRYAMLVAIVMLQGGGALAAEPIVGRASVTDGDTVVIHGTRIRLFGIDAPESAQVCEYASGKEYRCGQDAALALSDRIGEAPISCEPREYRPLWSHRCHLQEGLQGPERLDGGAGPCRRVPALLERLCGTGSTGTGGQARDLGWHVRGSSGLTPNPSRWGRGENCR